MILFDNSKVTVELREIVESGVNIWDFDYHGFYTGAEKTAFEQKVIDHYYFRQIGQETVGRWLHMFRTRVREIMPYYIQLYKSQELMESIDDPFGNVDITETYEEQRTESSTGKLDSTSSGTSTTENSGSTSSTSSSTSNTENSGSSSGTDEESRNKRADITHKYSNTPQNSITNINNYLTEVSYDTNEEDESLTKTSTATTEASSTGTTTHTYTKKGNQGVNTYAHDMKELREILLNIDMMIINELKDLFLQVY